MSAKEEEDVPDSEEKHLTFYFVRNQLLKHTHIMILAFLVEAVDNLIHAFDL